MAVEKDLDYLEIARVLGGRIKKCDRPSLSGFSAFKTSFESLRSSQSNTSEDSSTLSAVDVSKVAKAFEQIRQGYEVDRVLVDPELRRKLMSKIHQYKLSAHPSLIYRTLQSIRKSNNYSIRLNKTTRPSDINAEPYYYAAELAYSQLTYEYELTVDRMLTEPDLGRHFTKLCKLLAPSGSEKQFKWAALTLRKQRSLTKPKLEKILNVRPSLIERKLVDAGTLDRLDLSDIPDEKGVYSFTENRTKNRHLYISSSKDLRKAITPFRDAKPFRALSGDFWQPDSSRIHVEFAVFEKKWFDLPPRELAFRLIDKYQPVFNVPVGLKRMLDAKAA